MSLFRSEEHVRNWTLYDPGSADGTMLLRDYAQLFGGGMFPERLAPDYLPRMMQLEDETLNTLVKLRKTGVFWRLGGTSSRASSTKGRRWAEKSKTRFRPMPRRGIQTLDSRIRCLSATHCVTRLQRRATYVG
jgi:hypothetical protein